MPKEIVSAICWVAVAVVVVGGGLVGLSMWIGKAPSATISAIRDSRTYEVCMAGCGVQQANCEVDQPSWRQGKGGTVNDRGICSVIFKGCMEYCGR